MIYADSRRHFIYAAAAVAAAMTLMLRFSPRAHFDTPGCCQRVFARKSYVDMMPFKMPPLL